MKKVTPFIMFNNSADEAVRFYTSIFKDAKLNATAGEDGKLTTGSFNIDGQEILFFEGGPHFTFTEGISLFVDCENQAEVDYYWDKFLSNGGKESMCGWLTDKYGISWQIIPRQLMQMMGDKDPAKAKRVADAMLKMVKIDVSKLEEAYNQ